MYRQIRALWEVLSQQPVGIFVCAALPWAVGFAQEDIDIGCEGEVPVPGHLRSAVPGQRAIQLFWQLA